MRLLLGFLFWGVLLYLLWSYVLRPLIARLEMPRSDRQQDELVKDPVCQTYLPRSRALERTIHGTTRYFCSETCLRRYLGPSSIKN